ncbi:MAG TPA: hypothetical protein VKQ08_06755, partial [Cyclobacteriaceae bacterium]|nr:hypothetical protein [Cyclobacteriaceae bacterium]
MAKFDESWKEVFEGAEVSPSDSVWVNIDRDLANAEGEFMRRRVALYRRIAAASILFALLVGAFEVYRWNENANPVARNKSLRDELRSRSDQRKTANGSNTAPSSDLSSPGQSEKADPAKADASVSFNKSGIHPHQTNLNQPGQIHRDAGNFAPGMNQIAGTIPERDRGDRKVKSPLTDQRFFEIALDDVDRPGRLPLPEISEGPVMTEILRKLPAISGAFMEHKDKKVMHEQVWASVTAAAGGYNPNSNSSYNSTLGSQASASGSTVPVGSSYSFGVLAGMRVADRVVLQSGVQYMNQSIGSSSNISTLGSLSSLVKYSSSPSIAYTTTSPYDIVSANEFVSVPLQAGYLILDKRVGFQLNSGVSTDFFIRNTLSDPSGQRQSYSQSAGQDSPYRSVNFSGLMSSELSYKMGSHYRVSLVPGFRYSFNPILKSA